MVSGQNRWCRFVSSGVLIAAVVACGRYTKDGEGAAETGGAGGNASNANGVSSSNGTTGVTATTAGGTTVGTPCPSFEPSPGSACDPQGAVCNYPNCVAPGYRDSHQLSCVMGAWVVESVALCNVPACPEGSVYFGGVCDPARMPGPCTVTDACGVSVDFVCPDGVWQPSDDGADPLPGAAGAAGADGAGPSMDTTTGNSDVAPLACPAEAPYSGAPCCPERLPETCDYTSSTTTGVFIILPPDEGVPLQPLSCGRCNDSMTWEPCEIK